MAPERQQLTRLAHRFPGKLIETDPSSGAQYVAHHIINQRLLEILGPFTFTLVEIVRANMPPLIGNPDAKSQRGRQGAPEILNAVVGVVCRLEVTVDGDPVAIEEVGEVEDPHNWRQDGARLKTAMSDAFKRCAMRLGVGLHLWAQEHYYLDKVLEPHETTDE